MDNYTKYNKCDMSPSTSYNLSILKSMRGVKSAYVSAYLSGSVCVDLSVDLSGVSNLCESFYYCCILVTSPNRVVHCNNECLLRVTGVSVVCM